MFVRALQLQDFDVIVSVNYYLRYVTYMRAFIISVVNPTRFTCNMMT